MISDKETHRAARVEMYADWLAHDADGLAFNVKNPTAPIDGATTILAAARAKLAWAIEQIDQAIAADKAAHAATDDASYAAAMNAINEILEQEQA